MVREIGMKEIAIEPGYVGNITSEQAEALRKIWQGFFDASSGFENSGPNSFGTKASANGAAVPNNWSSSGDPKDAGIPKDDAAKDALKAKEEQQAMQALLDEYGPGALRDTFWRFCKADNPDTCMLRFLRARKWDVSRALAMLATCMKWRLDNEVEEIASKGDLGMKSVEKFLDQQRSGKTYSLGTTDNEQPICYIHVGKHFTNGQPGTSMQKYVIYAMETFRLLMVPPNDKVVLLFDMTGFGLRNMDWNCILFIVKCLEAYYPESLGKLYIHNAPWIFWGIWKILSPLLDPVVRNKVDFTKKPADLVLIPAERLPTSLGGSMTREFEFVEPVEGENDLMKDTQEKEKRWNTYMKLATQYEDVTRDWIRASPGDREKAEARRELLVKKLRLQQFELEPYVRGKTVYHRNGTIDGQGIVVWPYPQKGSAEDIRHVVGRKYCGETLKQELLRSQGSEAAQGLAITTAEQATVNGDQNHTDATAVSNGAAGIAALKLGDSTGAAAPSTPFEDAPQANLSAVKSATNGDFHAASAPAPAPAVVTPPNGSLLDEKTGVSEVRTSTTTRGQDADGPSPSDSPNLAFKSNTTADNSPASKKSAGNMGTLGKLKMGGSKFKNLMKAN